MTVRTGRLTAWQNVRRWLRKHRQQEWRLVIILGLLLFSIAFSFVLPPNYQPLVLAAPLAAAAVMVLLRWPPLGLILLIAANLALRVAVPFVGLASAILIVLTALWLIDMVARKRSVSLIPSPTILPLLFFVAVAIFAFIMGQLPWFPTTPAPIDAQLGGLFVFVLSFCAFLLTAHQIHDLRWLKWLVFYFLAHGAILLFVEIFLGLRYIRRYVPMPVMGGSMYWAWLIALSFSQALFNRKMKWGWRVLMGAIVAGALYLKMIEGRGWSSGWIPGLVAMAVIIWVARPQIGVLLTAVAAATAMFIIPLLNTFIFVGDNQYSATTRVAAWQIVWEIAKVNPILGLGPANYYYYTPLFSILGWHVQFNSHNNYIDILAQTGILGLICFLWFVVTIGRLGWRLRSRVPEGGFEQAFVFGALGGLAATVVAGMLGDWVLPFVYNIGLGGMRASTLAWVFLGGLLALDQIVKTNKASR